LTYFLVVISLLSVTRRVVYKKIIKVSETHTEFKWKLHIRAKCRWRLANIWGIISWSSLCETGIYIYLIIILLLRRIIIR